MAPVARGSEKRNLYEVRRQEESVKAMMEEKSRDIKTLHAGYKELSKSLKHYSYLVDRYEKMLEITRKARGLGERSVMDIMEMEKEALGVERDLKVTEQAMAAHEKRLALETDFHNFISGYYGHGTCSIEVVSKIHAAGIDIQAVKRRYFVEDELKPAEILRNTQGPRDARASQNTHVAG